MSDLMIHEGDEYIALYHDGPADGETDKRVATSDSFEQEVDVFASIDGLESRLSYRAEAAKQFGDEIHVDYRFVPADSDPVESVEDRGDRTGEFDRE